jgi:hypothetical protein
MLTSGGCNVLDMILEGAKTVVAADLNPRQNALLELKCATIATCSHEEFFTLFGGAGNSALFAELYKNRIRERLGPFARTFWDENGASFFAQPMWSGASGWAAWLLIMIARFFGLGSLIDGKLNRKIFFINFSPRRVVSPPPSGALRLCFTDCLPCRGEGLRYPRTTT